MFAFSKVSAQRLATCHYDLQRLFNEVIKFRDCTILVGYRDKAGQDAALASGLTKLAWPSSKHNVNPSLAVDVAPYLNCAPSFEYVDGEVFSAFVRGVAAEMGINIRVGADWDGLWLLKENQFNDIDHFELIV